MASTKDMSYGKLTFLEKVGMVAFRKVYLPLVLGWTLLTSPFHRNNRHKSWKRVLSDRSSHHFTLRFNVKQLHWALGNTRDVYENWMKHQGLPLVVDDLGENSRLLWIGQRRTDRVILCFHGGAFVMPIPSFALHFWRYILGELHTKTKETGFAMLQYSLVPTATFPVQLHQAVLAVQHLISMGVQPQNIQIAGDSAGANLALQLFFHILHPVPDVPRLTLSATFGGAYLMSPWVLLTGQTRSMLMNDDSDVIGIQCITYWSRMVLDGVPEEQRPYLEAYRAPDAWFEKLSTVVERVLITAGDAECLRDEVVVVADRICKQHPRAQFVLQKYGVHNDPYFNFFAKEEKKDELTPLILEWFDAGFE